jgi:hypothetical protein
MLTATEIEFVESSALTSSNVETAFLKLITQINLKLDQGFYDDKLDVFNYFGSNRLRKQHI